MFDAVHSMRTRFMTSSCFNGDRILGAILFEDTMDRTVNSLPTCEYLWKTKGIVPFLKIDKGLRVLEARDVEQGGIEIVEGESSVQILNPIPDLEALLQRAKSKGVYGTKARSLILNPKHPEHIDALVKQQFLLARRVLREGLIPIIEPEIDVTQESSEKKACEEILCRALLRELDALKEENSLYNESSGDDDENARPDSKTILGEALHQVMIKISLPEAPNQYQDCVDHPCCLKVVALSGGYDQTEANAKLSRNQGVVASFSRALAEGLSHGMTEDEFESRLSESLSKIYEASSSSSSSS
jgi:fructose-bisphosphate aldolase class I